MKSVIERWVRVRGAWVEANTSGPFDGVNAHGALGAMFAMALYPNTVLRLVAMENGAPQTLATRKGAEVDTELLPSRFASDTLSLLEG